MYVIIFLKWDKKRGGISGIFWHRKKRKKQEENFVQPEKKGKTVHPCLQFDTHMVQILYDKKGF